MLLADIMRILPSSFLLCHYEKNDKHVGSDLFHWHLLAPYTTCLPETLRASVQFVPGKQRNQK